MYILNDYCSWIQTFRQRRDSQEAARNPNERILQRLVKTNSISDIEAFTLETLNVHKGKTPEDCQKGTYPKSTCRDFPLASIAGVSIVLPRGRQEHSPLSNCTSSPRAPARALREVLKILYPGSFHCSHPLSDAPLSPLYSLLSRRPHSSCCISLGHAEHCFELKQIQNNSICEINVRTCVPISKAP